MLIVELRREIEVALKLARCASKDLEAWRVFYVETTSIEKDMLPAKGMAANASEVREVLLAIKDRYLAKARRNDDESELNNIRDLIKESIETYINRTKLKPSIASAFGLAKAKRPLQSEAKHIAVKVHKCPVCGGTRSKLREYGECEYCGHDMFKGVDYEKEMKEH